MNMEHISIILPRVWGRGSDPMSDRTEVAPWVQELTESVFGGAPFAIGDTVTHPDGRKVRITDGQYWGTYGPSNFWYWKPVLRNGKLGKEEHGYGWIAK